MNNFTTNVGHIVIATLVIAAAVILGIKGTITGGEAITLIAAAGSFSLGGAVASSSAGAPVPSSVATAISKLGANSDATPQPPNSTTTTTSTTVPNGNGGAL